MKVTLLEDYRCAPEGHTTYSFQAGDEVEGVVAEMAIVDGAAKAPAKRGPKPKHTKPAAPDNKG